MDFVLKISLSKFRLLHLRKTKSLNHVVTNGRLYGEFGIKIHVYRKYLNSV